MDARTIRPMTNITQAVTPPPSTKRGQWHEWARQMRELGYTYAEIAYAVGVSAPAVYLALHPDKRTKYKKKRGDNLPPRPSVEQSAD